MTHPVQTPDPKARDTQEDGRDGRTVGDDDDNVLESLGKAIAAPIAGADEDADTNPDRPFSDLTKTLPQGVDATQDPAPAKKPAR